MTKAFFRGGRSGRMISRADMELIARNSPLLYHRMQGYSSVELGDIKNSQRPSTRLWKKARWATGWIQAVDGATVGRLWYAAEYWVQDNMPKLQKGSDAYYKAVAKKFNDVVEKTQPNYTTMQRPQILRDPNELLRSLTMFMTQRLQNFNILFDAAGSYQKARADFTYKRNGVTAGDVSEARSQLVSAVSSQLTQAAVYVGFKLFADALLHSMKAYRDDDDGELTGESVGLRLLDNYIDATAGMFLGGSELHSILSTATGQSSWYGLSLSGVDSINDLVDNLVTLASTKYDLDDEKGKAKFEKQLTKVGFSLCQYLGIPANNALKIKDALLFHIEDIRDGEFGRFEAGYERTKAQNTEKLIRALESGDKDAIEAAAEAFDSDKDAATAVKGVLKERYNEEQLSEEHATELLAKVGITGDDAYWTIRGWEGEDKYTEIKAAVLAGDKAAVQSELKQLTEHGIKEKDVLSSVKSFIKKAYLGDELGEKEAAIVGDQTISAADARRMLAYYAGLDTDKAVETVAGWDFKKQYGFELSDRKEAYMDGTINRQQLHTILTRYAGKTSEDADGIIKSYDFEKQHGWAWSERKELFQTGKVSRTEMLKLLQSYGGKTIEEAESQVTVWEWSKSVPGAEDISVSAIEKYNANCATLGVDKATFVIAWKNYNDTKPDYDANGDAVAYSKTIKVMPQINALPISAAEKTAIALCFWAQSTVNKYKLW